MSLIIFASGASAEQRLGPDDPRIAFSHYAGTLERDGTHARIIRPINTADQGDPSGYRFAAPGARINVSVTTSKPIMVSFDLFFDGLVSRVDTYNARGALLVDNQIAGTFDKPKVAGAIEMGPVAAPVAVPAGTHVVTVVLPYASSAQLRGIRLPVEAVVNTAPASPSALIVLIGDSRLHGMGADDVTQTIAFRLAQLTGASVANLANGGRRLAPSDFTVAASLNPAVCFALYDFNDFYPNDTTTAEFGGRYTTALGNFRAGAAGKLRVITSFASSSDADFSPPGAYAANSPTLEQFRQAERDRIAARGDALITSIEGRGPGMPSAALANSADGVHFRGAAQSAQASVLAASI